MGLIFAFLAALFIAASNLFMRRALDAGGSTKIYLLIQMSIAFLVSLLMGPVKTNSYTINFPIVILGLLTGLLLASMLIVLGKALAKGPPGLTFSILSASSVMPAILMAFLFAIPYTFWHAVGSLLVLIGLFWAGRGLQGMQNLTQWVFLVTLLFVIHLLILTIYQWRALLFTTPSTLFTLEQIKSEWFTPMIYLGAALIQFLVFLTAIRRPLSKEWLYGFGGGLCNCLCTYSLIKSTEQAAGLEQAIIFPLFSIGTIFFSNLWGQYLYQEKVHWRACQVCASGILLGTIDWKLIASALGL